MPVRAMPLASVAGAAPRAPTVAVALPRGRGGPGRGRDVVPSEDALDRRMLPILRDAVGRA
eukprot:CAMPEP_0180761370 /NCGR_PEP_ID=MMETSP1038_2-20121128/36802_1 /TAXON_ID=632150 /ORGANISM="Azadinium spinosum, Strain 3D9" /LENGTH=60 /DNA_ID=CAMNT_0022795563 /DNA_START=644 /DNA_END=822 /DNA_ORIENTATION=-